MDSFTNRRMNEACEADEPDEHAPSRTSDPVKPSNMKARKNILEIHQVNQGPSNTPHTSPCGCEAMIHHEYIHHLAAL